MRSKFLDMLERWFRHRKSESEGKEESPQPERFFEKQKRERDIRDRIIVELNRPELEEAALTIYTLHGRLSVADPLDLQYVKPDPEKAASVRKEIDAVVETHGHALAEYMALKRKKYAESGVLNPSYVDAEVATALFQKGLLEKWVWKNDQSDRFWEETQK